MSRDTGIANRLRNAGLHVVEIAGWQTRGSSSFYPQGSVDHHTAGATSGNAPSLNICINGRAGLSGPLCNVLIGRDNTCYVIAAGRANHAGRGSWYGLSGNSSVYGIERENTGYATGPRAEPWRDDQHLAAGVAHAALMEGKNANFVCRHAEWTPRKIDTHSIDGNDLRDLVHAIQEKKSAPAAPKPPPAVQNPFKPPSKPKPEAPVAPSGPLTPKQFLENVAAAAKGRPVLKLGKQGAWVRDLQGQLNRAFGEKVVEEDGKYGHKTFNIVKWYQEVMGLKVDGVVGYQTWASVIAKAITG